MTDPLSIWNLTACICEAPRLSGCEARTQLCPLLVHPLLGYSHTVCQRPLGGWEVPAGGFAVVSGCLKVQMCTCLFTNIKNTPFKDFFLNVSMKTTLSTTLLPLSDLLLIPDATAPPTGLECEGSLNEKNRYHLHRLNR